MSGALVAMQFVLIGIVLLRFQPGLAGAGFALLLLAGIAVGVWALSANRPGNFNIRPEPKEGGQLVMRGLALAHPGYADYRARTRAIIPFVL